MPRLLAALLLLVPYLAAQGDADPRLLRTRHLVLRLPEGWRQMNPDDARWLKREAPGRVPEILLESTSLHLYPFGAIDAWKAGTFDGRFMHVADQGHEIATDGDGVRAVIDFLRTPGPMRGSGATEVEAKVVTIGKHASPAVVATATFRSGNAPDGDTSGRLDEPQFVVQAFVPTAGSSVLFHMQCRLDDREAGEHVFREIHESVVLARPARGPKRAWNDLLYAAGIGLLVALVLGFLAQRRQP